MMHTFDADVYVRNLEAGLQPAFDYRRAEMYGGWAVWQAAFRAQLRQALGMQWITRVAASVRIVERVELEGYRREKGYLATEPGIEIPFYLLLPQGRQGPVPLVLTPHGHGRRGKEIYVGNYEDDAEREDSLDGERDIALQAVAEGYAALAPDVRGFWEMAREEEVRAEKDNSCEELQRRALMVGRTLIGERVHDIGRLIDFAETRPEIDTTRVVITGNSGGGMISLFAAALDERISIAIPGSYFCTYAASTMRIYHCTCNIVPGLLRLGEMVDIAGLIAPRPVLMVNGRHDDIFPIDATEQAFGHLQAIYAGVGHPDRCELYVGAGGHRYYKERVWPFVREHLPT